MRRQGRGEKNSLSSLIAGSGPKLKMLKELRLPGSLDSMFAGDFETVGYKKASSSLSLTSHHPTQWYSSGCHFQICSSICKVYIRMQRSDASVEKKKRQKERQRRFFFTFFLQTSCDFYSFEKCKSRFTTFRFSQFGSFGQE